jgi:hypothetical protein
MSIVIVSLTTVFLSRVRNGRSISDATVKDVSSGPGAAVLLAAFGSYVALVVHDNFSGPINRASASSLALTGVAIVLTAVLIAAAYGSLVVVIAQPALVALGGIAAILSIATTALNRRMFLSASAVAVACMIAVVIVESHLILTARGSARHWSRWEIFGAVVTGGIGIAAWTRLSAPLSQHEVARIAIIAIVAVLLILGTFFGTMGRRAVAVFPITFVGVLVTGVAASAVWCYTIPVSTMQRSQGVSTAVNLLTAMVGLVVGLATLVVKARTDGVLGVPANTAKPGLRLAPDKVPAAGIALVLIALFAVGAFLATLAFVLAINRGFPFPSHTPWLGQDQRLLIVGLSAFLLAVAVFAASARSDVIGNGRIVTVAARIIVPAVVSAFLITDMAGQQVGKLLIVEAAAAGILVFLWTSNSVANNVWLMQGRRMGAVEVASLLSLAVLAGSTSAWTLTAAIEAGAHVRSPGEAVAAAVIALVVADVLVVLLGAASAVRLPHYTELPAWRGLAQDALSCSAITLILIFPVIYLGTVTTFWKGVFAALPIITFFAAPFLWIMKANREHPQVEARRLIKPRSRANALLAESQDRSFSRLLADLHVLMRAFKDPCAEKSEDFIRVLSAHTRNQNRIATAMILIPIAGALQLLFALAMDNARLSQIATHAAWSPIDRGRP